MTNEEQSTAGSDLIRIHRVITRALQVCLKNSQNDDLEEKDRPGFELYVRCLHSLLEAHHAGEDELAFPFWRIRMPDGSFDLLGEQHRQMIGFIDRVKGWLTISPDPWAGKDLNKFHSACQDLQKLWVTHIGLEEPTIGPENSLNYLTPAEREQLGLQLAEHGQAHSQPAEAVMPFILFNLSKQDRAEFSKTLPALITEQLVPVVWKSVWQPMKPFLVD
jgi:hypothetical protein